jgi:hypothetical protein
MRLSSDWHDFKAKLDKNYPPLGKATQLSFEKMTTARACNERGRQLRRPYFRAVLTAVNLVLSAVPTPLTALTIAIAMPAAIRPYSMAVAPVSSAKNLRMVFIERVWKQLLKSG